MVRLSPGRGKPSTRWWGLIIERGERIKDGGQPVKRDGSKTATGTGSESVAYWQGITQSVPKETSVDQTIRPPTATAYNNIGYTRYLQGNYKVALAWYKRALTASERLEGPPQGIAVASNNIGHLHRTLGNYERAREWYERSLELREPIQDRPGLAKLYHNLAGLCEAQGDAVAAIPWYQKSATIKEEIGDQIGLALVLHNLGLTHMVLGELEAARECCSRSRDLYLERGLLHDAAEEEQVLAHLDKLAEQS